MTDVDVRSLRPGLALVVTLLTTVVSALGTGASMLAASAGPPAQPSAATPQVPNVVSPVSAATENEDDSAADSRPTGFVVTELKPLPGDRRVWAADVNIHGQVVGTSSNPDIERTVACTWINGVPHELLAPLLTTSEAVRINDQGWIVGSWRDFLHDYHAVLWRGGGLEDLGTLGDRGAYAVDVNSVGQITGLSYDYDENGDAPFIWEDGQMRGLPLPKGVRWPEAVIGINDAGSVLGIVDDTELENFTGVVWAADGSFEFLPTLGGDYSYPSAINNDGVTCGQVANQDNRDVRVTWSAEFKINPLAQPDTGAAYPRAMNNRGDILGSGRYGNRRDFLAWWHRGELIDLSTFISPACPVDDFGSPEGVSDRMHVVGSATIRGEDRGYLLTPTDPRQIRKLDVRCRRESSIAIKVRARLPYGTFVSPVDPTGRIDCIQLDERGRAKTKWLDAGDVTQICLWEYGDGVCADVPCE